MATSPRLSVKRQRVTAYVGKKVTKGEINDLLEQIYRLSGCPNCGLNGFDVNIKNAVINPELAQFAGSRLANIPSIAVEEVIGG